MDLLFFALVLVVFLATTLWALAALHRARAGEERARRRLGAYLPPSVVADLMQRNDERPLARIHTQATVAVFRIRHFAQLVERLDPEAVLRFLNECYLLCGTAVHRNGGVIERLLDDGIVAAFGLNPHGPNDHQYRGIRAALEATRLIGAMKTRWETEGRRPLRLGVGVHTGTLVTGDVGFAERRAFALVGSTVTVAHQLQHICEEINAAVITSATTYHTVEERFVALPVKQLPLKHMHEPHDTFIIRGLRGTEAEETLTFPTTPVIMTTIAAPAERPLDAPRRAVPTRQKTVPLRPRLAIPAFPQPSRIEDARYLEENAMPLMPDAHWPTSYEDDHGPSVRYDLQP